MEGSHTKLHYDLPEPSASLLRIDEERIQAALIACTSMLMKELKSSVIVVEESVTEICSQAGKELKDRIHILETENEALKASNKNILKRLEMLEDNSAANSCKEVNPNLSTQSTGTNTDETESNARADGIIPFIPQRNPGICEVKLTAVGTEYRLIGSKEKYLDFVEPDESHDLTQLVLLELDYVLLEGSELVQLLKKCLNLKILRLSNLHFYEEIKEKVPLQFLEEFKFHRERDQNNEFIKLRSITLAALESQIIFQKSTVNGELISNLFDLGTRVDLKFGSDKILTFDPFISLIVTNFECTEDVMQKHSAGNQKWRISLSNCVLHLETVRCHLQDAKEVFLDNITFNTNVIIHYLDGSRSSLLNPVTDYNTVFTGLMRRVEKLYISPNAKNKLAVLSMSVLPFATLKWLRVEQDVLIKWDSTFYLDVLVFSSLQFTDEVFRMMNPIRVVLICSTTEAGKSNVYSFLNELLIQKSPASERTMWVWIKDFQRQESTAEDQNLFPVNQYLAKIIPESCSNFTIQREANSEFSVHENTEDEIQSLAAEYLPTWDKFFC